MGFFYLKSDYYFYNIVSKYFQFMFIHILLVLSYLYLFIYIKIDLKREINKIVKAIRDNMESNPEEYVKQVQIDPVLNREINLYYLVIIQFLVVNLYINIFNYSIPVT